MVFNKSLITKKKSQEKQISCDFFCDNLEK